MSELIKYKHILVVGFASYSGISLSNLLLKSLNCEITLLDIKTKSNCKKFYDQLYKQPTNIYYGEHLEYYLTNVDCVVCTPAVNPNIGFIVYAKKKGVKILTEINVGIIFAREKLCNNIIAITGTNGKSTVVYFLYEIFRLKFNAIIAGNIGIPLTSVIDKINENTFLILEISSYMLEYGNLDIDTACIVNIDIDHITRYNSFKDYRYTKYSIFKLASNIFIDNDSKFYNEYKNYIKIEKEKLNLKYNTIEISESNKIGSMSYINQDDIIYKGNTICNVNKTSLKGKFNRFNLLTIVSIAKFYKISDKIIELVISRTPTLQHRCEEVQYFNNIRFINDSKSTNISSTIAAINRFKYSIILILGGITKSNSFKELNNPNIISKVKSFIIFGRDKNIIYNDILSPNKFKCDNLWSATNMAYKLAVKDTIILFSPACSSFDQFADYTDRGNCFVKYVNELKNNYV